MTTPVTTPRAPRLALLALALLAPPLAPALGQGAAGRDPTIGLWRPADAGNGAVRTFVQGGQLFGRIERVDAGDEAKTCTACSGADKGAPLKGFLVIRGLKRDGDGWSEGTIVNPEDGKTYGAQVRPSADGRTLNVRGYVGGPLFGQTQSWARVE